MKPPDPVLAGGASFLGGSSFFTLGAAPVSRLSLEDVNGDGLLSDRKGLLLLVPPEFSGPVSRRSLPPTERIWPVSPLSLPLFAGEPNGGRETG